MMATMLTTSAISEERFLSEVSSKLDEIAYVFAPKLPGSLLAHGCKWHAVLSSYTFLVPRTPPKGAGE